MSTLAPVQSAHLSAPQLNQWRKNPSRQVKREKETERDTYISRHWRSSPHTTARKSREYETSAAEAETSRLLVIKFLTYHRTAHLNRTELE